MNVVLPPDTELEPEAVWAAVTERAAPYKELVFGGTDIGPEDIPDENLKWRVWDDDQILVTVDFHI